MDFKSVTQGHVVNQAAGGLSCCRGYSVGVGMFLYLSFCDSVSLCLLPPRMCVCAWGRLVDMDSKWMLTAFELMKSSYQQEFIHTRLSVWEHSVFLCLVLFLRQGLM